MSGSTIPARWLDAGDADLTPNQIRELQDRLNTAVDGLPWWPYKILVTPPGAKITAQP